MKKDITIRVKGPLMQPQEPAPTNPAQPSLRAFLELGFRPLYIAGTSWALIAVLMWIFAPQWLMGPLSGLAWHAHEMLWGFVVTIAVGFLMTAGANWTGINPMHSRALAVAASLWLVARVGFLVPSLAAFWMASAAELSFFLMAAVGMGRSVVLSRNQRNYAVPLLLAGLGALDAMYLTAALDGGDYAVLMQRMQAALVLMALVALLVGRRVIPFFAMRATPGLTIPMHTHSGWVQLGASAVAVASLLAGWSWLTALACLVAGALAVVQIISWKPLAVRTNALLWILYVGYALLGLGLLFAAAHAAGLDLPRVLSVHVIAMGGFSVLIIGMVTRTALGHLGRPLATDKTIRTSYWLILAAVALRLAAIAPSLASPWLLRAAALAWITGLGLYLWQFVPMLIRPRL